MRHLIVDGYNLSRSGELGLEQSPVSPEGRKELCLLLAEYARGKGLRLAVVFDGGVAPHRAREALKGGEALYAARGESADDVIRDLSGRAPDGSVVVTSDRGLRETLPSRKVAVLEAGEFAERLFAWRIEALKGGPVGEEAPRQGSGKKKGEGRKRPKRERVRDRRLRGL